VNQWRNVHAARSSAPCKLIGEILTRKKFIEMPTSTGRDRRPPEIGIGGGVAPQLAWDWLGFIASLLITKPRASAPWPHESVCILDAPGTPRGSVDQTVSEEAATRLHYSAGGKTDDVPDSLMDVWRRGGRTKVSENVGG